MTFKEQVQSVYPEAIFEKNGFATGFKQKVYKVTGIRLKNDWLIFRQTYKNISENELWEGAWQRIQKKMLRKFES